MLTKKPSDSANLRQAAVLNFVGRRISAKITSGGLPDLVKIYLKPRPSYYKRFDLEL